MRSFSPTGVISKPKGSCQPPSGKAQVDGRCQYDDTSCHEEEALVFDMRRSSSTGEMLLVCTKQERDLVAASKLCVSASDEFDQTVSASELLPRELVNVDLHASCTEHRSRRTVHRACHRRVVWRVDG